MNLVLTGATGLVGSHLRRALTARGDRVISVQRRPAQNGQSIPWDARARAPSEALISAIKQSDAIIHLAGENIASGRWTKERKTEIRESRIRSTEQIVAGINLADTKPRTFICASAVGYYGNRGDAELDETSASGDSWLSEVCRDWEDRAGQAQCRVVHLRFGVILSKSGGALPKMIRPFQFVLGGAIGNGRQWMSWVTIDDAVRAILYLLDNSQARGPVNIAAPEPVTNNEFTHALAKVLRRPALLRVPAPMLRLLLGEMADELLLSSQRVRPSALEKSGFRFQHRTIEAALDHLLKQSR